MNGQRAKKLKKLAFGATVAGAYPAAKRWWNYLTPRSRGQITSLVSSGELTSLGIAWRSTFVTPTPGAPVPTRSKRKSFRAQRYGF